MCAVHNMAVFCTSSLLLFQLYAGYLQLHICNKPCFYSTHCYSCPVFAVCATCNVISQVKYDLYLYISTFGTMSAVPHLAVFCSSLISRFPGMSLRYCLSDCEMVPVALLLLVSLLLSYSHYYYYYKNIKMKIKFANQEGVMGRT
jgi:hypothetical protein